MSCFKKRPFVLGPVHVVEVGSSETSPLTALVGVAADNFGTRGAHCSLVAARTVSRRFSSLGTSLPPLVEKCTGQGHKSGLVLRVR